MYYEIKKEVHGMHTGSGNDLWISNGRMRGRESQPYKRHNCNRNRYTAESKIEETDSYKAIQESAPAVAEMILQVNEGTMEMDAFVEELNKMTEEAGDETVKAALEEAAKALEGKTFVTAFVDITAGEDAEKNEDGKYEITLNVPSLTSQTTNVMVLHYSTERGVWEVIEPADVDVDAKTVTAEFEDLSPVAVIADAEAK